MTLSGLDFASMEPNGHKSEESFLQQADSIWKLLDELAEDDPQGYSELMEQQKKNFLNTMDTKGETCTFRPEPGFVIHTILQETEIIKASENLPGRTIAEYFVNVCFSERIQIPFQRSGEEAKTEDDLGTARIPLSVGKRHEVTTKAGDLRIIVDVVVHPLVVKRSRRDLCFRNFVATIALEKLKMLEASSDGTRSGRRNFRAGSVTFPKLRYKGGREAEMHSLQRNCYPKSALERDERVIPEGTSHQTSLSSGGTPTVMTSPATSNQESSFNPFDALSKSTSSTRQQSKTSTKPLIEELSTVSLAANDTENNTKVTSSVSSSSSGSISPEAALPISATRPKSNLSVHSTSYPTTPVAIAPAAVSRERECISTTSKTETTQEGNVVRKALQSSSEEDSYGRPLPSVVEYWSLINEDKNGAERLIIQFKQKSDVSHDILDIAGDDRCVRLNLRPSAAMREASTESFALIPNIPFTTEQALARWNPRRKRLDVLLSPTNST